jgi:hypothetical protein
MRAHLFYRFLPKWLRMNHGSYCNMKLYMLRVFAQHPSPMLALLACIGSGTGTTRHCKSTL